LGHRQQVHGERVCLHAADAELRGEAVIGEPANCPMSIISMRGKWLPLGCVIGTVAVS
jgi:hypothetical protein